MRKNFFYVTALSLLVVSCDISKNDKYSSLESRVDSLLSQMTIEEKLGQMNQLSPWDFDDLANPA